MGKGAGQGWVTVDYLASLAHAVAVLEGLEPSQRPVAAARLLPKSFAARVDPEFLDWWDTFAHADPERRATVLAEFMWAHPSRWAPVCAAPDHSAVFEAAASSADPLTYVYEACAYERLRFFPRSLRDQGLTSSAFPAVAVLSELASRGGVHPLEWRFLRMLAGEPEIVGASYRDQRAHLEETGRIVELDPLPATEFIVPEPFQAVQYPASDTTLTGWLADSGADSRHAVVLLHHGFPLGPDDFRVAAPFLAAGWTVFVPSYRGESNNPGRAPFLLGQVDDAESAARWLAKRQGRAVLVFGTGYGALVADVLTLHVDTPIERSASVNGLWFQSDFSAFDGPSWGFDPLDASDVAPRRLFGHVDEMQVPHTVFLTSEHTDPISAAGLAAATAVTEKEQPASLLVAQPLSQKEDHAIDTAARWLMRCADDAKACPRGMR